MRPARWGDIDTVVIEALLFYCHERKNDGIYVGEVTEIAQKILAGRGESVLLNARKVGGTLRLLGLRIEPRDSRGYMLLLTQARCRQVHELARGYDVPTMQDGVVRCKYCDPANRDEATSGVENGRGERAAETR
jgi:hypothetical protein